MKILEIDHLKKTFKDMTAVDGLSLTVQEKEVHGILGPNGAGKSTTINCILGLLGIDGGTVRFALGDYIKGDYGTFDEGKVYYYVDDHGTELCKRFEEISGEITESTGVEFVEVTDLRQARKDVEESKAYGVITIGETGYDYFRSTFNEPQGGKLVRTLFVQLSGEQEQTGKTVIQSRVIQGSHLDSKVYYTFSALTFAILFMGVLIGLSLVVLAIYAVLDIRELGKKKGSAAC